MNEREPVSLNESSAAISELDVSKFVSEIIIDASNVWFSLLDCAILELIAKRIEIELHIQM